MHTNHTKQKLAAGQTVWGCFTRYPDATLAEFLGYLGWDFLVFDGEHGTLEPRDCEQLTRAVESRGPTPIIRVPTLNQAGILRFMDTGAQGLHVPWINTADDAEAVVRAVKYLPRGQRGLAGVRAADYGQAGSLAEYVEKANRETLIAIHIETGSAVDELPRILKVPDLDVIFIGPTDLSHSLGYTGQPQHPEVQRVMQHIAELVRPTRAALGIMVTSAELGRLWQERGARYITITVESLLAPAMRNYLQTVRAPQA